MIELRARLSRLTIVVVVTLLVQIILVSLVLVFIYRVMRGEGGAQSWTMDSAQTSQEFRPGQALTVSLETVTVYVPPFAIPLPGSISMLAREGDPDPVAEQSDWQRPQMVDVQFRNTEGTPVPDLVLSIPIKICFKLTETEWEDYAGRPGSFAIQYYGLKKGEPVWLNLTVAKYPKQLEMCAQTEHLSVFALALKPQINIPVTGETTTPHPTATPTEPPRIFVSEPLVNPRERIDEPGVTIFLQATSTPAPANLPPQVTTSTPQPAAATPTKTAPAPATQRPTSTRVPPTATKRPTATRRPSTPTSQPTAILSQSTAIPAQSTATRVPTARPPTAIPPTSIPPTAKPPTAIPPTQPPPTNPPPTQPPPTQPPPTDPPPTQPPPTQPPPTEPPPTEPPPTAPPPTEPPPTEPPPTEPPPTEPPPTEPPPTAPPTP